MHTTCLFSLLVSLYILFSLYIANNDTTLSVSSLPLLLFGLFLAAAAALAVIAVVRTTVMTWITVVVLLALSGKQRRVIAKEGRKISGDIAIYLIKVLIQERGFLVAAGFTSILSFVSVAWLRSYA